jgi:hypothetical protein
MVLAAIATCATRIFLVATRAGLLARDHGCTSLRYCMRAGPRRNLAALLL